MSRDREIGLLSGSILTPQLPLQRVPWNSIEFSMDVFVTVTKEDVDAKIAAINAYRTQKHRQFFANDIVGDLARVRGKQVGHDYAECFELVRFIL